MIYPLINKAKYQAIEHPMVNMASFGALELFDNKATIKYPYVNFDIVSSSVVNYLKRYTIRMYVCDRNEPYIAYNKTEIIADDILKSLDIDSYTINYFTLEFKDVTNGVWTDFIIEVPLAGSCTYDSLFNSNLLLEDSKFILLENGDLIMLDNS
jgi:hypothetical protein